MPSPPSSQQERFTRKLGLDDDARQSFLAALSQGSSGRTALVVTPKAPPGYSPPFACENIRPAWCPEGVVIPAEAVKPGANEDYDKGWYYPLDLSSVWETAPLSLLPRPVRCLDLCASPGGKTILAQCRLSPLLHLANEVHGKRLGILRRNLVRSGYDGVYTQRLRPDQWAELAMQSFDLVLADAPCSGQSLLAKGVDNPGCFHPSTLKGNAKRQRSILGHALHTLAPGGHLLYTTCTFAPEENERTMAYLLKRHPELEPVEVPILAEFRSPLADFACYRLYPTAGWGSGGFSCLLRKSGSSAILPPLAEELLAWPVSRRDNDVS